MSLQPLISIVMPLYNKAESVISSIASIQAQNIHDWELIVINDGSTDDGPEIVRQISDSRIRVFDQDNAGVSAARNKGIELAKSDLIAFLDADDQWLSTFLSTILSLANDFKDAEWFATGYEIHHHREGIFKARLNNLPLGFNRGILPNYFSVAMLSDPPVWTSAMAVKKSAMIKIGCFPTGINSGEDLLTWARLAVRFPLAYEVKTHAIFDVSGNDRKADPQQLVTQMLMDLLTMYPSIPGLKQYLGFWCRTQAVMAFRFNDSALARRYAWRAFIYGPRQWRNGYTLLLAWLPAALRRRLDQFLRWLAGA